MSSQSELPRAQPLPVEIDDLVLRHARLEDGDSVLLIGESVERLCAAVSGCGENINCETVPEKLSGAVTKNRDRVWSLVVYVHRTVVTNSADAMVIIALARDVISRRVLHVVVNDGVQPGVWTLADSLSLGFFERETTGTGNKTTSLYEFNVQNYKRRPDWLNSKHWANPQMWNRR